MDFTLKSRPTARVVVQIGWAAMETTDYIELRQTPPLHWARAGRAAPTATLACALLLLLLLHAATTPTAALTRGGAALFGPPASADGTLGGLPASADGNFGLPASVVIVSEGTVDHAREQLRAALHHGQSAVFAVLQLGPAPHQGAPDGFGSGRLETPGARGRATGRPATGCLRCSS